jgi:hypothetical protein
MSKAEFPHLLPVGFHRFTLDELPATFVEPFTYSQRRPMLLEGLRKFAVELSALGIKGELWFDGSFVCEKNEPDDVDLVVIIVTFYRFEVIICSPLDMELSYLVQNSASRLPFCSNQ